MTPTILSLVVVTPLGCMGGDLQKVWQSFSRDLGVGIGHQSSSYVWYVLCASFQNQSESFCGPYIPGWKCKEGLRGSGVWCPEGHFERVFLTHIWILILEKDNQIVPLSRVYQLGLHFSSVLIWKQCKALNLHDVILLNSLISGESKALFTQCIVYGIHQGLKGLGRFDFRNWIPSGHFGSSYCHSVCQHFLSCHLCLPQLLRHLS